MAFSPLPFSTPTQSGIFIKRYKRFLADVQLSPHQIITAHVANPGSMKGCLYPQHACLLTHHDSPSRKLPYSLEAIQGPDGWIGVNTHNANLIASHFLHHHFQHIRQEVTVEPGWRVDFVATSTELQKDILIEVKNVSLNENGIAAFPDSVTKRGQSHLEKILARLKQNQLCGLLLIVQRDDVDAFHPAHWIDPKFTDLFWACLEQGLWIWIQKIQIQPDGFYDAGCMPLLGQFNPCQPLD